MYNEFIFKPLYNGLVYLMDIFPWMDIGIAVVVFTIIIKLILFPLSKSSLLTQVRMKEVEPEVNKIKAKYGNDRQNQALQIMNLYKEKKIKPFAGILLIIVQLPILFAIISVFYKVIPTVDITALYSFVSAPEVKTLFLGFIDLTQKSFLLSIAAAVAQYFQIHYSLKSSQKNQPAVTSNNPDDFAQQLSQNLAKQMKFFVPILAFVSTYWIIPSQFPTAAAIISIYWVVSALFTLGQELYIRKKYAKTLVGSQVQ